MNYEVTFVPIEKLNEFPNHPYRVVIDEDMRNLQSSITERGIDEPLIVREIEGRYQIVSGHRRCKASELAGLKELPVRIVDLDDDSATIMLVDSNLHRRELLPSELAKAYKMKYEALKHQGKIPVDEDYTSYPLDTKYSTDSAQQIANAEGTSRAQIYRYIRLNNLIDDLMKLLDEKKIAFRPAVELASLNEQQQSIVMQAIDEYIQTPSLSQAQQLKKWAKEGKFTEDKVFDLLGEQKPNQREHLKLDMEEMADYFPRGTTPREMAEWIKTLLDSNEYVSANSKSDKKGLKL